MAQGEAIPVNVYDRSTLTAPVMFSDAFAGGFVAGIVQGQPLEKCIDMAHWLAKLSLRELGPS